MKNITNFINEKLNEKTIGSQYKFDRLYGYTINSMKRLYPYFDKSYLRDNVNTNEIPIGDDDTDEKIKCKKVCKLMETWPLDLLNSNDPNNKYKWADKVEQKVIDKLPGLTKTDDLEILHTTLDNGDIQLYVKCTTGTGWEFGAIYKKI